MKVLLISLILTTILFAYSSPVLSATPIPPAATQNLLIDINTDNLEELKSVPHIGPKRAQAIIDYRQKHGDFTAVEELQKVNNISPKTSAKLSQYFKIGAREKVSQTPSIGSEKTDRSEY